MRGVTFRMPHAPEERSVYLTFDDGPIPEATPWVLDCLREFGVPATFFMVGDNARRYPRLVSAVEMAGHMIGNHTMHHVQGLHTPLRLYLTDALAALQYLPQSAATLFRPPHGLMTASQRLSMLRRSEVVLYDVLTRDYDRAVTPDKIMRTACRLMRPGSIVGLHDSLKTIDKLKSALPRLLEWLLAQGYECKPLPGRLPCI